MSGKVKGNKGKENSLKLTDVQVCGFDCTRALIQDFFGKVSKEDLSALEVARIGKVYFILLKKSADGMDFVDVCTEIQEFLESEDGIETFGNIHPSMLSKSRLYVDNVYSVFMAMMDYLVLPPDAVCAVGSEKEAWTLPHEEKQRIMEAYWVAIDEYNEPNMNCIEFILENDDVTDEVCGLVHAGLWDRTEVDPTVTAVGFRAYCRQRVYEENHLWDRHRLMLDENYIWMRLIAKRVCELAVEDFEDSPTDNAALAELVAVWMEDHFALSSDDALLVVSLEDARSVYHVAQCEPLFGKVLPDNARDIMSCVLSCFYYLGERLMPLLNGLMDREFGNRPHNNKGLVRLKPCKSNAQVTTGMRREHNAKERMQPHLVRAHLQRLLVRPVARETATTASSRKKAEAPASKLRAESVDGGDSIVGGSSDEDSNSGRGVDRATARAIKQVVKEVTAKKSKRVIDSGSDGDEEPVVVAPKGKKQKARKNLCDSDREDNGAGTVHPARPALVNLCDDVAVEHHFLTGIAGLIGALLGNRSSTPPPPAGSRAAKMLILYAVVHRHPVLHELIMLCRGAKGWLSKLAGDTRDPLSQLHDLDQALFRVVRVDTDHVVVRFAMFVGNCGPEVIDLAWPEKEDCIIYLASAFLTPVARKILDCYESVRPADHPMVGPTGPEIKSAASVSQSALRHVSSSQRIAPVNNKEQTVSLQSGTSISSVSVGSVVSQQLGAHFSKEAFSAADNDIQRIVSLNSSTPLASPQPATGASIAMPSDGQDSALSSMMSGSGRSGALAMSAPGLDKHNESWLLSAKPEQTKVMREAGALRALVSKKRLNSITGATNSVLETANFEGLHMLGKTEKTWHARGNKKVSEKIFPVRNMRIGALKDSELLQKAFLHQWQVMHLQQDGDLTVEHFLQSARVSSAVCDSKPRLSESIEGIETWFFCTYGWENTMVELLKDLKLGEYDSFTYRYFISELLVALVSIATQAELVPILSLTEDPRECFESFCLYLRTDLSNRMSVDAMNQFYQGSAWAIGGATLDRMIGDVDIDERHRAEKPAATAMPPIKKRQDSPRERSRDRQDDRRYEDRRFEDRRFDQHDRRSEHDNHYQRGNGGGYREPPREAPRSGRGDHYSPAPSVGGQFCITDLMSCYGLQTYGCRKARTCKRDHKGEIPNGTRASVIQRQAANVLTNKDQLNGLMDFVKQDRQFKNDLSEQEKKK